MINRDSDWSFMAARDEYAGMSGAWDELNGILYDGHPLFDSRFVAPTASPTVVCRKPSK